MSFVAFLLGLIAIIWCFCISDRLNKIEKTNNNNVPLYDVPQKTQESQPVEVSHQPTEPSWFSLTLKWLCTDWPMKLGAFLIFLGILWFLSIAFAMFGPIGKISMGFLIGILILMLGEKRIHSHPGQGGVLLILGSAIFLITVWGGQHGYHLFNAWTTLGLIAFITLLLAASSVKHKLKSIAVFALIVGALNPLIVDAGLPEFPMLFTYLLILSAGLLGVVGLTGWRFLTLMDLVVIFLYSDHWMGNSFPEEQKPIAYLLIGLFVILFYGTGLAATLKTKKSEFLDLLTSVLNGIFALLWVIAIIPEEWRSLVAAGLALFYILAASLVFKNTALKPAILVYGGIAMGLIAAAIAFELNGPALTLAYTIQSGAISVGAAYLMKSRKIGEKASALLLVPIGLSSGSIVSNVWVNGAMISSDFFVLLILMVVLFGVGSYFKYIHPQKTREAPGGNLHLLVGLAYFMILIWLELKAAGVTFANGDSTLGPLLALIIYAVMGFTFYSRGKKTALKEWIYVGGGIMGLTSLILVFGKGWGEHFNLKIFEAIFIGALFIRTAWIKDPPKKPAEISQKSH